MGSLQHAPRRRRDGITSVWRSGWLDQQQVRFLLSERLMGDPAWDNVELAGIELAGLMVNWNSHQVVCDEDDTMKMFADRCYRALALGIDFRHEMG